MPNVFRKEYRELSEEEKALLDSIKDKAQELWDLMDISVEANPSRRASQIVLAKEKLEESVMWAVKAITG